MPGHPNPPDDGKPQDGPPSWSESPIKQAIRDASVVWCKPVTRILDIKVSVSSDQDPADIALRVQELIHKMRKPPVDPFTDKAEEFLNFLNQFTGETWAMTQPSRKHITFEVVDK